VAEWASEGTRTIIASALYGKTHAEGLGFAKPVAEIIDDDLRALDNDFCQTGKIFITGGYMDLEKRFPSPTLFRLTVSRNTKPSENVDPADACKYIAHYEDAEPLKNRELFEVIQSPLPDPTMREVQVAREPGTNFIFVDDGADVYGPFKWSAKNNSPDEITLSFIDTKLPGVALAPYTIYKIERNKVTERAVTVGEGKQQSRLLNDIGVVQNAQLHDYASDEDVVRFIGRIAQESNQKLVEKSKFDNLIALLTKINKPTYVLRQRLARLPTIVASGAQWQNELSQGMGDFFKSEQGRSVVAAHVEANQTQYLDGLRKQYETELRKQHEAIQQDIKNARQRLDELEEEKKKASAELEKKRREAKASVNLDAEHLRLDAQMVNKRAELAEIEQRISERVAHSKALANMDHIRAETTRLESKEEYAKERATKAKDALNQVLQEIGQQDDVLRRKLMGYKPYVDAINGSFLADEVPVESIAVPVHASDSKADMVARQREVIASMCAKLASHGRPMDERQVANLLISTQQSFLTVFAGLPGVGKTSLARLLPGALGLQKRVNEIAVARGWTSQKDLIGFHNPLANRFQASGTGLYNFLLALDEESDAAAEFGMAYALLDEANLSPIEHYWSCFMGMADGEGSRQLALGERKVQIPSHLRFLATINYDGTTEPLSPRVTDRAAIILLEPSDPDTTESSYVGDTCSLPISSQAMSELFGNELHAPEFSTDELAAFNAVRSKLSSSDAQLGVPISISARKILAIRQYCAKARGIMGAANDDLLALDVAIKQHVLPQVRGNGRFGERLKSLARELDSTGLRGSAEIVRRMIEMGESDLQSYDFFYW
jgi:hypothetical protein